MAIATRRITLPTTFDPHRMIVQAAPHITYQDLADGGVLLNVETGDYFSLNSIGSLIWKQVSRPIPTADIVAAVRQSSINAQQSDLEADVMDFVDRLIAGGLLQVVN